MKKILVPVDFSENAENALFVAAEVARKSGAALELLHVNVASVYAAPLSEFSPASGYTIEDNNYDESAGTGLERIRTELLGNPEYAGLSIQTRVGDGYLHSTIKNVAEEDDVDLVVMGTKGASGLNEFLLGSNTEKVIRTSPCPVLAVPAGAEKFIPKTVLLPTTLKDDQLTTFRFLAEWQKIFGFNVQVLYMNNPSSLESDSSAEDLKNTLAKKAGLHVSEAIITTESFFEDTTILGFSDQIKADLIVMATHQRKGISHVVFGSITEDTVNHSLVPVLAVPVSWTVA